MKRTILAMALGMVVSGFAVGQNTASFYAGGGIEQGFNGATGWQFTVNAVLNVNMLGYYDLGADGLGDDHNVGLFDSANPGVALATAVIPAGTGATLIDGTRFVGISAVQLNPGTSYYLLADNNTLDNYAYANGIVTFSPEVNWTSYSYTVANDILDASVLHPGGLAGNLGPNFRYGIVPEPASMAVLGMGALALIRRRKK